MSQSIVVSLLAIGLLTGATSPAIGPATNATTTTTTTTTTTKRTTVIGDDLPRIAVDNDITGQLALRHYERRAVRSQQQRVLERPQSLQRSRRQETINQPQLTMDLVSNLPLRLSDASLHPPKPSLFSPSSSSLASSPVGSFPSLIDFLVTADAETTTSPEVDHHKDLLLPSFVDVASFDYSYYTSDLTKIRLPWTADPAFAPTVIVYGMAFAFGLVGNLFVIVALLTDRKRETASGGGGGGGGATNSFLVSLAVADVLFLAVCLPYEIGIKLGEGWRAGRALCKVAAFVEMATATASVLNLVSVSIER